MFHTLKQGFLLLLLTCLVACTPSENEQKTTTDQANNTAQEKAQKSDDSFYVSKKFNFRIQHPLHWQILRDQMPNVPVVFVNRSNTAFASGDETVSIAVDKGANSSLDSYFDYSYNQLVNVGDIKNIKESHSGVSSQGANFRTLSFDRNSNNVPMKVISYLFYNNDAGYVISCSTTPQKFEQMKPFFEDVVKTMTFL